MTRKGLGEQGVVGVSYLNQRHRSDGLLTPCRPDFLLPLPPDPPGPPGRRDDMVANLRFEVTDMKLMIPRLRALSPLFMSVGDRKLAFNSWRLDLWWSYIVLCSSPSATIAPILNTNGTGELSSNRSIGTQDES